uniref:Uncharacterized protein n=1 Tax=Ananas comosus var. bracteatus TaxID=296719 RepID=A0A6V7Q4Z0_ANACO|nr:unnamed protein product [Ananas comosus var. bracteatus]
MGKDHDPWHQVPHSSPWGFGTLNCGNNLGPPTTAQENTNSMGFPAYVDPSGAATFSVNGAVPFPLYHNPMIAAFGLQEITSSQRKFTAFDQSRNQTSLIHTSVAAPLITSQGAANPLYMDLQGSNETNVTDGNGVEEMHEDTEEIDALLYSDSEDYVDEEEAKEEEEASTGHFPVIISKERSIEEVASSKTLPTKKRRLDSELDASLVDTASSVRVYYSKDDGDVESSCVGAGEKREEAGDDREKEEEEEEKRYLMNPVTTRISELRGRGYGRL